MPSNHEGISKSKKNTFVSKYYLNKNKRFTAKLISNYLINTDLHLKAVQK